MKRAFTLVELLTTILVLGMILLITVPRISDLITNSAKATEASSAQNYVDTLNKSLLNGIDGHSKNASYMISVEELTDWASTNVTGKLPTSGVLKISKRNVLKAVLEMDNYTVVCDKANCSAIEEFGYVYYTDNKTASLTLDDKDDEVTTNAYIKYEVLDGELGSYQACINDNSELCISNNEYEISKELILNFFGSDSTNYCEISTSSIECLKSNIKISSDEDGNVSVDDITNHISCSISDDGSVTC